MEPIDAAASIGELVSWLCLVPGIPALLAAWLLRVRDGGWSEVEIIVVRAGERAVARWYAGGGFHERRLSRSEGMRLAGDGAHVAHVSERDPSRMRLPGHPPAQRMLLVIGAVLTAAGLVGFALSLLPLLA